MRANFCTSELAKALTAIPYYHRTNPRLAANAYHVLDQLLDEKPTG